MADQVWVLRDGVERYSLPALRFWLELASLPPITTSEPGGAFCVGGGLMVALLCGAGVGSVVLAFCPPRTISGGVVADRLFSWRGSRGGLFGCSS